MLMVLWNVGGFMRQFFQYLVVAFLFLCITACSSGRHVSQSPLTSAPAQDRTVCETEVHQAAPLSIQPRWWLPPIGAGGSVTSGVVLGTADVPHPIWSSREAYQRAIERCLMAHGYETRASSSN